jgi:hypothetical protein
MRSMRMFVLCVTLAGCRSGQVSTGATQPAPRSEWNATFAQASQDASAGRYAVADRVLTDFATRNPSSADAVEAIYWRALYKLDPANQTPSPREAAALLDSYLASFDAPRKAEAVMLRRLATLLETRTASPSVGGATTLVPKVELPADKAKDDEIQRLKDELAKANAELERIKRRLAQPKP